MRFKFLLNRTLEKIVLTHRWSGQSLTSNQLGGAEAIQEVTELSIWGQPHTGEDEAETDKNAWFMVKIRDSYWLKSEG